MDNLTLEILSAYLPWDLKIETPNGLRILKGIDTCVGAVSLIYWIDGKSDQSFHIDCKPLLHSLSIQFLTSVFPDANDLEDVLLAIEQDKLLQIRYDLFTELVKNHVDVFYLLNRGLAVEIKEGV